MDVSVGIERGQEPARGTVDFVNKKIEARVTPEGIRRGLEVVSSFLNRPDVKETITGKLHEVAEKMRRKSEEMRREREKGAVSEYARQEGQIEKEVVEELLDELQEDQDKTE